MADFQFMLVPSPFSLLPKCEHALCSDSMIYVKPLTRQALAVRVWGLVFWKIWAHIKGSKLAWKSVGPSMIGLLKDHSLMNRAAQKSQINSLPQSSLSGMLTRWDFGSRWVRCTRTSIGGRAQQKCIGFRVWQYSGSNPTPLLNVSGP